MTMELLVKATALSVEIQNVKDFLFLLKEGGCRGFLLASSNHTFELPPGMETVVRVHWEQKLADLKTQFDAL